MRIALARTRPIEAAYQPLVPALGAPHVRRSPFAILVFPRVQNNHSRQSPPQQQPRGKSPQNLLLRIPLSSLRRLGRNPAITRWASRPVLVNPPGSESFTHSPPRPVTLVLFNVLRRVGAIHLPSSSSPPSSRPRPHHQKEEPP